MSVSLHHHSLLAGSLQNQLIPGEVPVLAHQLAPCQTLCWALYLALQQVLALDDQPSVYLGQLLTKLAQVRRQGHCPDQNLALWQLAWTNRVLLLGWGSAGN